MLSTGDYMIKYDKLVRDRIPEIIEESGKHCETRILSKDEHLEYLNKKLGEELNEYLESGDIEELADLEEVLRGVLKLKNVSYEEFDAIRQKKCDERGAFEKGIALLRTYKDGE